MKKANRKTKAKSLNASQKKLPDKKNDLYAEARARFKVQKLVSSKLQEINEIINTFESQNNLSKTEDLEVPPTPPNFSLNFSTYTPKQTLYRSKLPKDPQASEKENPKTPLKSSIPTTPFCIKTAELIHRCKELEYSVNTPSLKRKLSQAEFSSVKRPKHND